ETIGIVELVPTNPHMNALTPRWLQVGRLIDMRRIPADRLHDIYFNVFLVGFRDQPKRRPKSAAGWQACGHFKISVTLGKRTVGRKQPRQIWAVNNLPQRGRCLNGGY